MSRCVELDATAKHAGVPTLALDSILAQAWSSWSEGNAFGDAGAAECDLPATRVCFRGLDNPFSWQPPEAPNWLPEPGTPLSWRLYRFVAQWEATVLGESC